MDKFILGENPMRKSEDIYIVHLLNPIAIFQAHQGTIEVKEKIFHHYQFRNSDRIVEEWTLSTHHFFSTDFIKEPSEQVKPLMDRAWRWYRSYMEWEDNNIDLNDYANEN